MKSLHVEIEPTNHCNTRCLHCPHETITRPKGYMSWEVYQRVADQVMAYAEDFSVEYAGMGDPLLHSRIYDFVGYVSGSGHTSITTNAAALTTTNMAKAIDAGLDRLTISFNATDPELYELMMGGLSFAKAEEHLSTALRMTEGTRTTVAANVSVTKQTQDRLPAIKQYLENAGVSTIAFSKCHNRGGFLKGDLVCDTPPPPVDQYRCDIFTKTLFVAWTGEVLSCCHDLAGSTVVGDLEVDPLEEVFRRKRGIAADGVTFDICQGCNDLYRFMGDRTPDGRPIADWVYELYTGTADAPNGQVSSLATWMRAVYDREGQADRLFAKMVTHIEALDTQVAEQDTRIRELGVALEAAHASREEVLQSRSWRTIQSVQRLRHALAPQGSLREALLLKLFG